MATKTYRKPVIHHCSACGQQMEIEVKEFRTFGGEVHKTKTEPHCTNPNCVAKHN